MNENLLIDHQWELLVALRNGKKLLFDGMEKESQNLRLWVHIITTVGHRVSVAPTKKVTRLYGFLHADGFWSSFDSIRVDRDTHYIDIDSNGNIVTPLSNIRENRE